MQYEKDSLLINSVKDDSYSVYRRLLENGANPNWQNAKGETAMIEGCYKFETSKYVNLAIEYGADVNLVSNIENDFNATPLLAAAAVRFETVKLLVEKGADVNYMNEKYSPLYKALAIGNNPQIVKYLLIDRGASLKRTTSDSLMNISIEKGLKTWTFPLDSDEYKIKMEIVDFIEKKGYDYRNAPIPKHYYDNYSKEYLEKY